MVFFIQDSDDVYGLFGFHPRENQSIQSQPEGRFLSLSFLREGGTMGELDSVQLVNISPQIPSVSPRFGGALNISLIITPDIANGEIGFTSNQTVVALEPEDSNVSLITLQLRRDGTDGQAVVFWSLRPTGENREDVTVGDISPFTGSVRFLSGQSEAVINITVMADNIPEINETVILTLDRSV
ncbi:hypothetical protein cypCar_00003794 [Cyprinus carpio]|nr:hypothetical protein cypCar_00003794 [Cyprinus carpio]